MITRTLSYGTFGTEVAELQRKLTRLGCGSLIGTGFFGTKTAAAVTNFKQRWGISTVNTLVEDITAKALNSIDSPRMWLYAVAKLALGKDASPDDIAPDSLACMETVDTVYSKAFGYFISGGDITISTYTGRQIMLNSNRFKKVDSPLPGCIVISATGTSTKYPAPLPNGHVGIVLDDGLIANNNSYTSLFDTHYTLDTWKARYVDIGGYPMDFFMPV